MTEKLKKIFKMTDNETHAPETELAENGTSTPQILENHTAEQDTDDAGDQLQKDLNEAKAKFLYLFSDFENYKRNIAKERFELMQTAGRDILSALLPILDDFDRAAKNDGLPEGIALIHQKLANTLQAKGLVALELKAGDAFNADEHHAIAEVPGMGEGMKGKIVDVVERGYKLGEKIIRHPKVVVGI